MKNEYDEWRGYLSPVDVREPTIVEPNGTYHHLGEVSHALKVDMYTLAKMPIACDIYVCQVSNPMMATPIYFHENWLRLARQNIELAKHSMLQTDVLISNTSTSHVYQKEQMTNIDGQATNSQIQLLQSFMGNTYVRDVEKVRIEEFLADGWITKRRISHFIKYFLGEKRPTHENRFEYVTPGVLYERRQEAFIR